MSALNLNEESIPEILKEIDSAQETEQYSAVVEHRWPIKDIYDLVIDKRPGEKLESEQFFFTSNNKTASEDSDSNLNPLITNKIETVKTNKIAQNSEIICEQLLETCECRVELQTHNSDWLQIGANFSLNNQYLFQAKTTQQNNISLIFKLKFYLLNSEVNLLFKKQQIEQRFELNEFQEEEEQQQSLKLFKIENFCQIKELIRWLIVNKSSDFCLILDLRVYGESKISNLGGMMQLDDVKSRLKSRVSKNKNAARFFSTSLSNFSTASSMSWFQLPDTVKNNETDTEKKLHQKNTKILKTYKFAWMIKNWRDFLMLNSAPHTFLNNTELPDILNNDSLKFSHLKSKTFTLSPTNKPSQKPAEKWPKNIHNLLQEIKWKLQLYPNGYNKEVEKNLSLFVNFCRLDGELELFKSSKINELLYDKDEKTGLILLMHSPDNQLEKNKKKKNFNETFIKASFQISIIDSSGRKVDKCQSETQLFELYGSWGYKEYMSVKELFNSSQRYLTDNQTKLTLHCKITLFYTMTKKINFDSVKSNLTFQSKKIVDVDKKIEKKFFNNSRIETLNLSNTLLFDMKRLLKHSIMYDLVVQAPLNLNDPRADSFQEFKVHKLILAIRSQVFENMFKENCLASSGVSKKVDVLSICDFEAFIVEIFLNYLYTDNLDVNLNYSRKSLESSSGSEAESEKEDCLLRASLQNDLCMHVLIELFKMSDKYCVHRLKRICEQQLETQINVENVVELLILAYLHGSARMKSLCFEVLGENLASVFSQPNWAHLEKNYPPLLAEAFRVVYVKKIDQ